MKKILEIGLYVFLFLFPWQTRWIFQSGEIGRGKIEYLTYSIYATDVLLAILLCAAFFVSLKNNVASKKRDIYFKLIEKKWRILGKIQKTFLFCGVIFWIAVIFSAIFADDKLLAMQKIARLGLAFGLGWLIYHAKNYGKILFWFSSGLVLPAWLAIWQFLSQQTFANKWLGLAKHDAWQGGTSVVETFDGGERIGRWLRAYGSFDHPNILGVMMVIGILVTLGLALRKMHKTEHAKYLYWAILASLAAGCFVSMSRSAWLALSIGLMTGTLMLFRQKQFLRIWLKGIILIVIIFLIFGYAYKEIVFIRAESNVRLEQKSLNERIVYLKQGKEMIKARPILGVGIGNYIFRQLKTNPNQQAWEYQPVHNVPLMVWAEMGIFGLLAFVSVLLILCIYAFKNYNFIASASFLALSPVFLLDHWFWSLPVGLFLLAIVGGMALKNNSGLSAK